MCPEPHRSFPLEVPEYDLACDIDEDIIDLVETLNRFGLETTASCQEFERGRAFVNFSEDLLDKSNNKKYRKLEKAIDDALQVLNDAGSIAKWCGYQLRKERALGLNPGATLIIECEESSYLPDALLDNARREAIDTLVASLKRLM